jgi:hypothetical protein
VYQRDYETEKEARTEQSAVEPLINENKILLGKSKGEI